MLTGVYAKPRQEPKLRDVAPETELKVGADAGADSKKLEPTTSQARGQGQSRHQRRAQEET